MAYSSWGKTLKELRHGKGMMQSQLAELLAISPQSVSKWETDTGYRDLPLLAPISDIFGVTIDYLLGKGENMKSEDIRSAKEKTLALWRALLKKYPTDNPCRNALKIIDTVCYNSPYAYFDSYFSAYFLRCICTIRVKDGDFGDDIYNDIKAMIHFCKRADEEKCGKHYFEGNLFMDSVYYEHDLYSTEMKWAKELLDSRIFDEIRWNVPFQELMKEF